MQIDLRLRGSSSRPAVVARSGSIPTARSTPGELEELSRLAGQVDDVELLQPLIEQSSAVSTITVRTVESMNVHRAKSIHVPRRPSTSIERRRHSRSSGAVARSTSPSMASSKVPSLNSRSIRFTVGPLREWETNHCVQGTAAENGTNQVRCV